MFIGHFGVGLAAKPLARQTSLGTLFLASQFIDLLWPTFLLLGVESVRIVPGDTRLTPLAFSHYPWSHSLLAVVGWAVLFAVVYFVMRRSVRAALVCGSLVLSHWVLDLVSHRPDLPLYPGGAERLGLGLWNRPVTAILVESAIFATGAWLYWRSTRPVSRAGSIAFWALVGLLAFIYAGNLAGPPPPSEQAIAWVSQAQWLIVALGYYVDHNREPRSR